MKRVTILAAALCVLMGCSKDIQNSAAVKQAVLDHLKSRSDFGLNLDAMDIQVSSVSYREKEADAQVAFVPKGGPAGSGMSMSYKLERDGDKWVVKSKAMTGAPMMPNGAMPGGPGTPGAAGGEAPVLPPGHVAVPTPGGAAPKGTK